MNNWSNFYNISNPDINHSCGYHDISPFSPDEKHLVFCSVSSKEFHENKIFSKNNLEVYVNIISLDDLKIKNIFKSKCYTLEQGIRINWIDNIRITINGIDKNKLPEFTIFNIKEMKIEKVIKNYFCHQISGDNNQFCTSLDYSNIHKVWPSYGFNHEETLSQPSNTLNVYNWKKNKLVFRVNIEQLESYKKYNEGFIIHPTMSKDGENLLFMHRLCFGNILYSWLYLVNFESGLIKLITEEKVSHFTWINNDKFLLFQRLIPRILKKRRLELNLKLSQNSNKDSLSKNIKSKKHIILYRMFKKTFQRISSGFVLYKIKSDKINKKLVSFNLLGIDCHPFYSHSKKKIFLDSYPDKKKFVNIFSFNIDKPFLAEKEMKISGDWETHIGKVDAHIRFSSKSNFACIDGVLKKRRFIKIFKIPD